MTEQVNVNQGEDYDFKEDIKASILNLTKEETCGKMLNRKLKNINPRSISKKVTIQRTIFDMTANFLQGNLK